MATGAHRKVVTVLFCDLVGSTALGESVDAEALQALLARYFDRMKGIVELHGGSVEKFIGDAVMAVFGVPAAHEDDALRACRAAVAMSNAFHELGVIGRIGVNTGEVVTGTAERLATGDAINVAKRLESAAQPGEVLIGSATLELVRTTVEVAEAQMLELKGKTEPVAAHRLRSIRDEPERSSPPRLVGRVHELEHLVAAWASALAGPHCELVTVLGDPGIGKSRLIEEALTRLDVQVVRGRCGRYGEGAYGPVLEVVRQLDRLPDSDDAAAALRSLVGESNTLSGTDEIAWGFRKLLEKSAPLVVYFDDIQRAEETVLDLIESTARLSSGAALLVVCCARPELLDRRPDWQVTLRLQPLSKEDASELVGDAVSDEVRERVIRASGGNPLFLTEMVKLSEGGTDVQVPPNLRALLAARLDQLGEHERSLLERGAVEGELFHCGALAATADDETPVLSTLAALVRRDLVLPDQPTLAGEDAYRLRHVLVRDAACEALAKATRAELHHRLALWLDKRGDVIVELDELVGYHLEQAARYLAEIDRPDPATALSAGRRLAIAGRRALWRGDNRTAAGLLDRSLRLTRLCGPDLHTELDLAWSQSNPLEGAAIAERAAARAGADSEGAAFLLAQLVATQRRIEAIGGSLDELEEMAHRALPLLEAAGDDRGLVHVWNALVVVANTRGRYEDQANAALQALEHSRRAQEQVRHLFGLGGALLHGPAPAEKALELIDSLLPEDPSAPAILNRALLLAMLDRFGEAWEIATTATERLKELGEKGWRVRLAEIAWLEGDYQTAFDYYKSECQALEERGQHANLSTFLSAQARSLCALQRYEDARPLCITGQELASWDDLEAQVMWRRAQGLVEANRGEHGKSAQLLKEAVDTACRTDSTQIQAEAYEDLGVVLEAGGQRSEALDVWEEALNRYEHKQIIPLARRLRERLAEV